MNVEIYLWSNLYQKVPNSTVILTKSFLLSGNDPQRKQIAECGAFIVDCFALKLVPVQIS